MVVMVLVRTGDRRVSKRRDSASLTKPVDVVESRGRLWSAALLFGSNKDEMFGRKSSNVLFSFKDSSAAAVASLELKWATISAPVTFRLDKGHTRKIPLDHSWARRSTCSTGTFRVPYSP